ncbi:MAG TPA: tetratricopeptide repeat protein [Thermoanaerobaculia bacterium]|nr:tetratricopeptide repeat protein [Thermoanaerobaculia bacterium]
MRRLILALALLLLAATASAQQQQFILPRPDAGTWTVRKNIEYAPRLVFDLYRPAGDAVVPVVIFANVGFTGMKDWPGYTGWGEAVGAAGLAAVHYDATEFADFDKLVAVLQQRASELRIDPTRIVVWSGSTNVRLGLSYAMDPKRDYIRGAIVYYGDAEVSSIRLDLPVFFARAGRESTGLNQRIDQLLARAIAANAPWTIVNLGHGVHGFDVFERDAATRDLVASTIAFAKSVTQPAVSSAYLAGAPEAAVAGAFYRGEWPAAIEGYRALLATRDDAENHRRLGLALAETGQFAQALPELEKAWQGGRRGPRDTIIPAAEAAARAGNPERALYWLDLALAQPFIQIAEIRDNPKLAALAPNPAFQTLLTEAEQQRNVVKRIEDGQVAEAIAILQRAKTGRLTREPVLNQIAYALLNRGRAADAVTVFRLATGRYPKSPNAWDSLSEALERSGAKKDAVAAARKALALLTDSVDAPTREGVRAAATARVGRLE